MDGEEFTPLRETPVPEDVVVKEIEPVQGITAIASGEGEGNLMQFVEYRDEWRILFVSN